ncbi:hypothetical protein JYU34_010823 [Plutella xylostella]|uniref:Uncharacterized protein n=1 Tax=Plutella xylostella TaxID=51655 RepID=A0ABQ7QFC3_PLUXY|nr:hypothetical protein JYU34_010823 [Plutella xylostella]
MEVHLHLSQAFRALDRKWGQPVDLDTAEDTALPVVTPLEPPTATFSSEEFLRKVKRSRQTPYSRLKPIKTSMKDVNLPVYSSKEDISSYRTPYSSCATLDSGYTTHPATLRSETMSASTLSLKREGLVEAMKELVEDLELPIEDSFIFGAAAGSTEELDQSVEKRRVEVEDAFKQLKEAAFRYLRKRCRKNK